MPLVIGRHTHPQAQRELPPQTTSTGIDYLKLLAEQRDAELGGQRIDYASLTQSESSDGDGNRDADSDSDSDADGGGEARDTDQEGDEG